MITQFVKQKPHAHLVTCLFPLGWYLGNSGKIIQRSLFVWLKGFTKRISRFIEVLFSGRERLRCTFLKSLRSPIKLALKSFWGLNKRIEIVYPTTSFTGESLDVTFVLGPCLILQVYCWERLDEKVWFSYPPCSGYFVFPRHSAHKLNRFCFFFLAHLSSHILSSAARSQLVLSLFCLLICFFFLPDSHIH